MNARPLRCLLAALPLLLAACGLTSRSHVPIHYYTIEMPRAAPAKAPAAPAKAPAAKTLAIARLGSPSHYRDRIFYRDKERAAGYYENDRWVEAPADLLTRLLQRALQDAAVARTVASEALLHDADLLLAGELLRFDIVRDARDCVAECEVQIVLRDLRTRTVLLAQRLAVTKPVRKPAVPVARPGVPAMVDAMNEAARDVVAKATEAVAAALASPPEKPPAAPK
jgi:ABC-type uncharacterized transport system auxiliary subunit